MKKLILSFFLITTLIVHAKTVVIGSGSGSVSKTSMSGLSSGDVLAITPGTYSGATFSNLTGITITNNGGAVTFTGSNYVEIGSGNTNLTIIGLKFLNVANDAFLLTGTNIQGLYIYNCTFTNVANNIIDVSGYAGSYTGTEGTLKVYRFAMNNCKFTNCGQVWQGWYGSPADNMGLCDSVAMAYDTVINTATNGTEVAGPISHINIHHWIIKYSGANPVPGDVGAFQTAGDGQIHDMYFSGGRGYLCRQLLYGLNGTGAFYFYNNIIYGQNAYGAIDIRCDPATYGAANPYLRKANAWIYNCTMGNKTDVNGYVCPFAIVGTLASASGNATVQIRNIFAFNNQYGANPIANNNANGSWAVDTANNVYSDAAHALLYLQDTATTFMPLAASYLNTHGASLSVPYSNSPDLYGYGGSGNRIGAVFFKISSTLPVGVSAFGTKKKYSGRANSLSWQLADANEIDSVIIQVMRPGREWNKLKTVSSLEIEYDDYANADETVYYRLALTARGKTVLYSWIIRVQGNIDDGIRIEPNPFVSEITITVSSAFELRIMDAMGRMILTKKIAAGRTTINPALAKGFYIFEFINPKGIIYKKAIRI